MTTVARWGLAVVAAVGLGIDAYTHFDLAHNFVHNTTGTVNEAVLFQVEGALAIVAALWILLRPGLLSALFTVAIAGGGAVALLIYRYYQIGKIGPLPPMSEPIWYPEKKWALAGELIALAAAVILAAISFRNRRRV